MSYEGQMLQDLGMPPKAEVESHILRALLNHRGVIKEFATGAEIVDEIADQFALNREQRTATLERIYRKENRTVHSLLWHRLLFRAADSLAKSGMISRPTATFQLTGRREWMLTEKGFDSVLVLEGHQSQEKETLGVRSYEVQKIVKKITSESRPVDYNPIALDKKMVKKSSESYLRHRGFRQAVIEAYDYKCAFCGLKLSSPNGLSWEVEAAHIVPNTVQGKDDVWNGIALCKTHHWAFDVGWLTLDLDFVIQVSNRIGALPSNFGQIGNFDLIRMFSPDAARMSLPLESQLAPHENAISWHRVNRFVC